MSLEPVLYLNEVIILSTTTITTLSLVMRVYKVIYIHVLTAATLALPSAWWVTPECLATKTSLGSKVPVTGSGGLRENLYHPWHQFGA